LYLAERGIAERLRAIMARPLPWPSIDTPKAIAWAERQAGVSLADGQKEAVRTVVANKVTVITGGPGVGKTTVLNSVLRILAARART
jgi:exodeoxyribonuclease V alpha subunit